MSVYVVDASVAAKWFLEEKHAEEALRLLGGENPLHAPDFLLLEMDSIFCKRIRRGDITYADGEDARRILRQLPIERHDFTAYLDNAYAIANMTGRSIYDSLYVALALLLGVRLVTADRRLYDAINNGPFKKHAVWIGDIK